MEHRTSQPGFPAFTAAATVTIVAAALAGVAMWLLPRLYDSEAAFAAAVFASVLVWATGMVSLAIFIFAAPMGIMPAAFGYFVGMFVRMGVCLGAAMVAFHGELLPGRPMAAALAILYMPLLLVEVAFIGRYLWTRDNDRPAASDEQGLATEVSA